MKRLIDHFVKNLLLSCLVVCVTLGFCLTGGCQKADLDSHANEVLSAAQDADLTKAASGYDVTNEAATAFAQEWEDAMVNNRESVVRRLFDWEGVYSRVSNSLGLGAREKASFENGMREANITAQVPLQIAMACEAGGSYKFVRLVRRDGMLHAIFRLHHPEMGMNYHDMRLARQGGNVVADRLFVAITGEEIADTFRALALPMAKSQRQGTLSKEAQEEQSAFETMVEMMQAVRSGQPDRTKRLYRTLPSRYQISKPALLAMIMALSPEETSSEYLEILDKYTATYPDDPSVGLIQFDSAFLRKDWGLVEESRKRIQQWTGGDSYFDLLTAAVLANEGQLERAVELSKDIDPASFGIASAHDFKLAVALANRDFATVLRQLEILRDTYQWELEDLRLNPDFAEFCQSPEYRAFISK